jgi:hypothetical protein
LTLCSVKWNRYKGVKFGVHDVIGSFITAFRKSNIYMECVTGSVILSQLMILPSCDYEPDTIFFSINAVNYFSLVIHYARERN